MRPLVSYASVLALLGSGGMLAFQIPSYLDNLPADHPAILYQQADLEDPITKLAHQVQSGSVQLRARPDALGLLPDLLSKLGILTDSQALAFARGSFQAAKISPRNPRAIYFTDDAAVGYVPGGDEIELIGVDPKQGPVFYTLNTDKEHRPIFQRQTVCLRCHQGPATLGVPGIFVASVFPSLSGIPSTSGAIVTDHRTRFEDRWGGWYVTGEHGSQHHRGNAVALDPGQPEVLETDGTQNLSDLRLKFNPSPYLSPTSDIVALMTLEHQTQITNLFTRAGWEWRMAGGLAEARLHTLASEIVAYMLFADEAFPNARVKGVTTFAKTFAQRGPRDSKGRSLREFDLQKRLFRFPLSYMIYSASFDALPDPLRDAIYHGVFDVLAQRDTSPKFAKLSSTDRRAIFEVLRDTKTSLPAYWKLP